jgi:hypothetical protein
MKYLLFLFLFLIACKPISNNQLEVAEASPINKIESSFTLNDNFQKYWYQGKAEISRYELSQNRYGDNHPGEAIHIFVTEDFLTDKQVKNDRYKNKNSISVLKNNMIRQFSAGIYDYSMMTSVFTPIDRNLHPNTLKITTSSQDWCGQSFQQINLKKDKYKIELRSYFESEADQNFKLDYAFLEDEIFNRIRLGPENLPLGKIQMIPSTQICRLMHLETKTLSVEASKYQYTGQEFEGKQLQVFKISFPSINRVLEIVYEETFPYQIIGWKDSYPSMFDKKVRTTIAKKTHERFSAYWQENNLKDMALRKDLGL